MTQSSTPQGKAQVLLQRYKVSTLFGARDRVPIESRMPYRAAIRALQYIADGYGEKVDSSVLGLLMDDANYLNRVDSKHFQTIASLADGIVSTGLGKLTDGIVTEDKEFSNRAGKILFTMKRSAGMQHDFHVPTSSQRLPFKMVVKALEEIKEGHAGQIAAPVVVALYHEIAVFHDMEVRADAAGDKNRHSYKRSKEIMEEALSGILNEHLVALTDVQGLGAIPQKGAGFKR